MLHTESAELQSNSGPWLLEAEKEIKNRTGKIKVKVPLVGFGVSGGSLNTF